MITYLLIAQLLVALTLIVLVMLQAKGAGLGNVFGGGDWGVHRTRRGVEKTLYNATIATSLVFISLCLITVSVSG
jgi:preprotein translocase subunit SecG